MKTKFSLLIFAITFYSYSQTTISTFNSVAFSEYAVVMPNPEIDQSADGANVTWTFNALTQDGATTSTDTFASPTAGELSTYPGTDLVSIVTNNITNDVNKVFTKDASGTISMTGITRTEPEVTINYDTDNALIGTFPMAFGTSNVDNVAGTLDFGFGTPPVFTGTITSTVDAYGTLNINDIGYGTYSGSVTRLKIVQSISFIAFNSPSLPGTADQTTYNYYDNSTGDLVFRTNLVTFFVEDTNAIPSTPVFDETGFIMESTISSMTLSTDDRHIESNTLSIAPNPVINHLNIGLKNNESIQSVSVLDINGRQVFKSNTEEKSLQVSNLKSGLYIATVKTKSGLSFSHKFVKK